MSGGRFANLTDPSAIHSTPANIAGFTKSEGEVNFSVWHGDVRFTQAGSGDTVKMRDPWKVLGSFYFVQPIVPGKVTVGLGVTTPFGLDEQWPREGPLKYLIPYEARLLTADFNPVLAFKPSRSLSVGVGLDILYSSIELKQLYPWSQLGVPVPDGTTHYKGDGVGVGAFAGVTWQVTPRQRLTLIGRLPVSVEYEGHFRITNTPQFLAGTGVSSVSEFKSEIRFPGSIAAGYGIDITDRLTAGVDVLWAFNSSHDDVPLDIGNNQTLLGGSKGVRLDWKDAITVGVGLQYKVDDHWTLRAGYLFTEGSQPDATYTPAVPSNDIHLFSAGVGYRTGRHSFDLGYSYSYFPDRIVTGNVQPAFNGRYEIGWHVLTTSYSFRF